jgi:uncharacterized protein (TIGR03000 family)
LGRYVIRCLKVNRLSEDQTFWAAQRDFSSKPLVEREGETMKRLWLKVSVLATLSAAGWLATIPQPAQGQVVAVVVGVWGWRNIVAPRIGGPFVAPEIRFRPFAGFAADSSYRSFPASGNQALVVVTVPNPNAEVWIQGQLMPVKGRQRMFTSPTLEPGQEYTYEIRARWSENEQTTDQTRTVPIRPGEQVVIDFARPTSE